MAQQTCSVNPDHKHPGACAHAGCVHLWLKSGAVVFCYRCHLVKGA